jgi:GAF domain-containing protein
MLLRQPGTSSLEGPAPRARVAAILKHFDHLASLTTDSPGQRSTVQEFRSLFDPLSASPFELTPGSVAAGCAILDRMQAEEDRVLAWQAGRQAQAAHGAAIVVASLCAALLLAGAVITLAARRDYRRREATRRNLVRENLELEQFTRDLALVSAGSELIQSARDETHVREAVTGVLRDLVPASCGYFGMLNSSSDLVEISSCWGTAGTRRSFAPADCVALQSGRMIHRIASRPGSLAGSQGQVTCPHAATAEGDYICLPLGRDASRLGVMHIQSRESLNKNRADAVSLFGAHVALGLTNLRKREALLGQSVRDSLTGLFNRRYFDETLRRELAGFRRDGIPRTVLMMDVDHFKCFNDTFGHSCGDDALRVFAGLVRTTFRENDVSLLPMKRQNPSVDSSSVQT